MQPHRRRRSSATPFLPPPGKPKDISLIDNADELLGLLRRTNEQLTRCPPTVRETLENRCSKIQARLEHVNSMKKVATDLRDTHITQPPVSDDMSDVSMDDAVLVPPPPSDGHNSITVDTGIVANHQLEHSSPILDGQATVMSTKMKIFTMPVVPQPVNKANPRGVRMIDDQTSLRIQQEEMSRRREHQRAQQEARVEKERKIIAHTEEAAARVVAASHSENDVHQPYQEDMERRAGITAFMNYRPDSDDEDEDDDDGEGELDDEAMEALLEAEFEDGIKGQAIFDPDGLEDLIRVDPDHLLDVHMAQGP